MCRECRVCDACRTGAAPEDSGCVPLLIVGLLVALSAIVSGLLARYLGGAWW